MATLIWVVPGRQVLPGRVVLWEKNAEHPGGEIYLVKEHEGETPAVQVAETPAVLSALAAARLVKADAPVNKGGRPKKTEELTGDVPAETPDK